MPEKWEKQENETQKNYNLFCVYRDLGITRSLSKVSDKVGKSRRYVAYLQKLSAVYKWVERAEAYDAYLDEENRKANVEAIKKMNEEVVTLAQQMRKLPSVKLAAILRKLQEAVKTGDHAATEEATKDIPLYLVPQLIEMSFMLERKARGVKDGIEVDATVKHTIDPAEVRNKILSKLRGHEDDAHSGNTSQSPES